MLRDAAGFAFRHIGGADGVKQGGLAVVDMTHDRNHRWTRYPLSSTFFAAGSGRGYFLRSLLLEGDHIGVRSEEPRHFTRQFGVERLIDRGKDPAGQQPRDEVLGTYAELFGKILYADALCDRDAARDRLWFI